MIFVDQHGTAWPTPVELGATPVDCVFKCHGGISVGSGFCAVHDVAAGAAGVQCCRCDRCCGSCC